MTATPVDVRASTSIRDWLAVVAVGLGVFAFTTTEMVPIGLLTTMSDDLGVSEGSTGLTVTLYGAIAGLFAPVLTSATRRLDRRTLLLVVLAVFVVGNALTAMSPTYGLLMFSRLLTGFAHGVMWSISASIAVRLVAPEASVRATAVVFSGISVASVIGVPLGTFIGEAADWRAAFWVIAALGAVTAVAAAVLLPSLAPLGVVNLRELPRLLRVRNLRVALLVTAVVVVGHFAAYTYVTPFLERNTGVETRWISGLLLLYGVAGIVGNFAAGAAAARALRGTIIACLIGLGGSVALLVVVGTWHPGAIALLLLWGVAYTALPVALQTLVFRSAPDAPEAATSLYILAFNVSISLGALFGGIAIDNAGPTAVMVLGVVLSLVAAAVMAFRHQRGEAPR
ncbi:MFS transporter [Actinosynnema sp. NPDC091369]